MADNHRNDNDQNGRRDERPRGGRPAASGQGRGGYGDRPRRDERPSFGDRDRGRPSYGDRPRRDERPSYGDRDRQGGGYQRRDDRDNRSFSGRPRRDERPSYGDRPRRDERPSYGDRDRQGGGYQRRDDRDGARSYGDRPRRDERPSYGDRDRRGGGYQRRDDRDNRGYGDPDRQGGGYQRRDDRDGARSYGDRPRRDERPSYGDRDRRGGGYQRRDDRGGYRGGDDRGRGRFDDERRGRDGRAGGHAMRAGRRFEGDRDEEHRGGPRLVPTQGKRPDPRIDEDVTGFEIDRSVKNQLLTISKENAQGVGQHLVMTARLLDAEDYESALAHAEVATRRAGRVPAVREALGLVHYSMGDFAKALTEFRTARRLSGSNHLLPYLVDCERALGRPEKALELAHSPEARNLPAVDQVELIVIESGIRRDLGQLEASKVGLEVAALDNGVGKPWYPRLAYAYAEALLALGDDNGAREWFGRAAINDHDGTTDADERLAELDGYSFVDLMDGEDDDEQLEPAGETRAVDPEDAHVAPEPPAESTDDDAAESDDSDEDEPADEDAETDDEGGESR